MVVNMIFDWLEMLSNFHKFIPSYDQDISPGCHLVDFPSFWIERPPDFDERVRVCIIQFLLTVPGKINPISVIVEMKYTSPNAFKSTITINGFGLLGSVTVDTVDFILDFHLNNMISPCLFNISILPDNSMYHRHLFTYHYIERDGYRSIKHWNCDVKAKGKTIFLSLTRRYTDINFKFN